jgi:hypothetical protein
MAAMEAKRVEEEGGVVVCGSLAGDLWSVNSMRSSLLRNLRGWGSTSHTESSDSDHVASSFLALARTNSPMHFERSTSPQICTALYLTVVMPLRVAATNCRHLKG